MDSSTALINGIIYKISSNDNQMIYYGLTTQNIEDRYQQHIKQYNIYKSNPEQGKFCSSFTIFDTYSTSNTSIHIVEEHNNITLIQLRNREKYYIHNFDSVNILAKIKNKSTIKSKYLTLDEKIITHQMILENPPIIHNVTQNITHLIQLLGYDINKNNTLILQSQTTLSAIKKHLLHLFQTYYPDINIDNNKNTNQKLLNTINLILNQHDLQIITYNQIFYKYNTKLIFINLLIYPYNKQKQS